MLQRQVFKNLTAVVEASGTKLENIVKTTVCECQNAPESVSDGVGTLTNPAVIVVARIHQSCRAW